MSNQLEVDSMDMQPRRNEQQKIYARLRELSKSLNCDWLNYNYLTESKLETKNYRVISSLLGDLIPNFDFWNELDKLCHTGGKKIWFVTDNLIDQDRHSFKNIRILSFPQLLGMAARDNRENDISFSAPSRLYNCFMQRCEFVRQSWFYFLLLEGLLDKGYVSYLLYQLDDYSKLTGVDLFDFIHYNKGLDQLQKFQGAHQALRSRVPYRNFKENFDLITYINDSKYSIILETYAVDDDRYQWCFTEKALRSLQSNTINLFFAQKYSIKCLENLGLEIDPINQQWDGDEWVIRQRKILEILKNDDVPFDVESQKSRCSHNRSLLQSWKTEYQRSDFFNSLIEEIESS